jgi:glutathione S-transferase
MRLYSSTTSPFVRKVRVVLHELGLAERCEIQQLVTAPHEPNPELGKANPLNKIPALELDDGTMLYDSTVICEYLDSVHGRGQLLPASGAPRWQVLRTQALADGIVDAGILVRGETEWRPQELRWPQWLAGQRLKMTQGLSALEATIDRQPAELDLGGIAIACMLGWLEFRALEPTLRQTYPLLSAWNDTLQKRPSLAATKPFA